MKRLIIAAVVLMVILPCLFAGGSQDGGEETKTYKFIYGCGDAVGSLNEKTNAKMVELLREKSNGQIEIDWYPGGQLGSHMEQIQSTMGGTQALFGAVGDWLSNWDKDFNLLSWGFTFRDRDHAQKFLQSDLYKKMTTKLEEEQNVKILGTVATDPRILFSKTPVKTLGDIENKKMRVPEIEAYLRLWEALGTRPTRVAWAEVYMGLKQGVVDACEGPVVAAYSNKFHEAAPYVTLTRHINSTFFIMMNGDAWKSLTPELQAVVQECADEALEYCGSESQKWVNEALDKMKAEGATLIEVDNIAEWQNKVQGATAAMEEKGMFSAGLVEQIQAIK